MSICAEAGRQSSPSSSDLFGVIPAHVGPRLLTSKGGVVYSVRSPGSMTFRSPGDFISVLLTPVSGLESRLGADRMHSHDASVGTLIISPANVDSASRWASLRENVTVGFEPGRLAALAAQELGVTELELQPPPFGHVDEQALQLALLLRQELLGSAPNELYVDSLMTVLGLHVVRRYSNVAEKRESSRLVGGGLSPAVARRVQDFLKEHFSGKVSIQTLAELVELSPSHFIYAFTRTFGEPPHRYLIKLRLSFAKQMLSETQLTIAQVAYLSGFSSQSHLTTAMGKYKGTTPARIRASR